MINALDIFESVSLKVSISEREFIDKINLTLNEMASEYKFNNDKDNEKTVVYTVDENIDIDDRYLSAIVDNILYLSSGNADFKSEFIRKAKAADLSIYRENTKGRKLVRRSW